MRMEERKLPKVKALIASAVLLGVISFLLGANFGRGLDLSRILPFFGRAYGETVSASELKNLLEKEDFTLINVHTPYEGEIENTDLFIAYDEMVANKDKLPKDKTAAIVLYCKTGRMSEEALGTLQSLGYTNVRHLSGGLAAWQKGGNTVLDLAKLPDLVLPKEGFTLPASWADFGPRLIQLGVIDLKKFESQVELSEEQREILTKGSESPIRIDNTNSQFVVDLLWALGLSQKSLVYEEGPLGREYKKDVGNFASTGGWTLAKGDAVGYLNKFDLIPLTPEEQKRVGEIAKNIYRPCCGNSTWFPDCNHGMAALAAIELLVSKGLLDEEIYRSLLSLNSFWFPQTYITTATYFARSGISWDKVDAKEVLGEAYSSGRGAAEIAKKVGALPYGVGSSGSCGT